MSFTSQRLYCLNASVSARANGNIAQVINAAVLI